MRLINADALMRDLTEAGIKLNAEACSIIAKAQEIDAVQVTRCVECKYCPTPETKTTVYCHYYGKATKKNGFCHVGTPRRENDGTSH